jgi:hypothetical protein
MEIGAISPSYKTRLQFHNSVQPRFWLWENWRYPAAAANRRPPLYAIFLEF